jgi:CheY-like chemotaxis protein
MEGQNGKFEVRAIQLSLDDAKAESLLSIEPGPYIRVSFGDTGSGMDEATLARIFEPFFTTKAQGEGTGLGLSVVYGLVERQRGAISAYSEPGKGTVFHIYFPVAEASEEGQPSHALVGTSDIQGHGERILYVDDDEALVFMMTRMLRRLGYEVTGFQHSREALEAFKANPHGFDLLITDMSMPHMDGPALVRDIQGIRPNLPIVMVTGYIRPKDLEQTRTLGIRELLLKPSTFQEMGAALHRILREIKTESSASLK